MGSSVPLLHPSSSLAFSFSSSLPLNDLSQKLTYTLRPRATYHREPQCQRRHLHLYHHPSPRLQPLSHLDLCLGKLRCFSWCCLLLRRCKLRCHRISQKAHTLELLQSFTHFGRHIDGSLASASLHKLSDNKRCRTPCLGF